MSAKAEPKQMPAMYFDVVFEAKLRAMILMLRKYRNLSDEDIKEVMATQVERALRTESAQ